MTRGTSYVSVTDQFCGAGGSSLGAAAAGAEIKMAMNHWKLAIQTHNSNFPETDHDCTDISACDPRRYPTTDILITSPECVNHSLAKGVKRKSRQLSLLPNGQPDPAAERSRATMWDVCRFAEYHRYKVIIVENVPDARHWELWDAWLHAMTLLGYEHRVVYFNSMFALPTPQSRDRMYVVFWRKGNQAPDLDFFPPAWCGRCARNVDSVQSWKNPKKKWGKYRQQYVYRCPQCAEVVEPYYYAALNAIDWSIPAPRIGDRPRPLKPKTVARIEYGLKKFAGQGILVDFVHSGHLPSKVRGVEQQPIRTQLSIPTEGLITPPPFLTSPNHRDLRAAGVDEPQPTQTAGWNHALVQPPFLGSVNYFKDNQPLDGPLPTQTTGEHYGVVDPFLVGITRAHEQHPRRSYPIDAPLPTQAAQLELAMCVPPFVAELRANSTARQVTEPLATLCASGQHHAVITPPMLMKTTYTEDDHNGHVRSAGDAAQTQTTRADVGLVQPFVTSYYSADGGHDIGEALPTVSTVARHALVTPAFIASYYGGRQAVSGVEHPLPTTPGMAVHCLVQSGDIPAVEDCGFRMLTPGEVRNAMAFPGDYIVLGGKREQIKQLGNAVTPPVLCWIMERVLATLGGGA